MIREVFAVTSLRKPRSLAVEIRCTEGQLRGRVKQLLPAETAATRLLILLFHRSASAMHRAVPVSGSVALVQRTRSAIQRPSHADRLSEPARTTFSMQVILNYFAST
jgi:hypothetical protein